jgi:hypothetical protein
VWGGEGIGAKSDGFVLLIISISQLATELGETMTLYPIPKRFLDVVWKIMRCGVFLSLVGVSGASGGDI